MPLRSNEKRSKGFNFLFGIPFWASWFFVASLLLKMFFQVEELLLFDGGIAYTRRILKILKARVIPLAEIQSIGRYTIITDGESGTTQDGLEIQCTGKPLRCFQGMPKDELAWVQSGLNEVLAKLRGTPVPITAELTTSSQPAEALALSPDAAIPAAPADSDWRITTTPAALEFQRRGRFAVGGFFGIAFICIFWNSIVSVFVAHLWGFAPGKGNPAMFGAAWLGMFVFLLPFEVIGLVMLSIFLATLAEPFHYTRWTFTSTTIECWHRWFGIGPRWRYDASRLARITLQRQSSSQRTYGKLKISTSTNGPPTWSLRLIDPDNKELCAINNLTEGEARWIGQTLLHQTPAALSVRHS